MRKIFETPEYLAQKETLERNVIEKIDYLTAIIETQNIISTKVAKKLVNTNFYEVRIQVNNEYRILTVILDHYDINQCTEVVFVNAFLKKDTKDYSKQIKKAINIYEKWTEAK